MNNQYIEFMATLFDNMRHNVEIGINAARDGIKLLRGIDPYKSALEVVTFEHSGLPNEVYVVKNNANFPIGSIYPIRNGEFINVRIRLWNKYYLSKGYRLDEWEAMTEYVLDTFRDNGYYINMV
jgi:hypothetical protein